MANVSTELNYSNLLPIAVNNIPPYPVYYNNQIIVSICVNDADPPGIYSYDINNNTYNKIADYPNDLQPNQSGLAIDKIHHELYIVSGVTEPLFAVYSLLTKQWKVHKSSNTVKIEYPESFYACSPIDHLYFLGVKDQQLQGMQYSRETGQFTDITQTFPLELEDTKMIFDEQRQMVMLFGGTVHTADIQLTDQFTSPTTYLDTIWYYDTNKDDQWLKCGVKLPIVPQEEYKVVYAFGSIVFMLYFNDKERLNENNIFCLELNTQKWYKSHLRIPVKLCGGDVVKTDDNYIHIISYWGSSKSHVRINLYDMIPPELFEFYAKYYANIIFGYVRINIENKFNCHVSNDLKYLIAKYYDNFS
eukprot:161733_1